MTNTAGNTVARKAETSSKKQAGSPPAHPRANRTRKESSAPPSRPVALLCAGGAASNDAPRVTKQNQLAALLLRDEGATLNQMTVATGWLPHTTRAALTGLRKKGYGIDSEKVDGLRTYRAVAPK
jgi:Protein of unknown function (DUF3489).